VLKSPLFGLDDEDLFKIAWERKTSLRTALRAKAPMDPRFAQAVARLDRLAQWAHKDTPFGFYARVLGAERGSPTLSCAPRSRGRRRARRVSQSRARL
jgi:ATP-dependent helicase/nuclease subunit A